MKRLFTILTIAGAGLAASACSSDSGSAEGVGTQATAINIHWTDVDPDTGETVVKTKEITRAQAQWLVDARAVSRARAAGLEPQLGAPAERPVAGAERVGSLKAPLTAGSIDWSDCQSYEWMLVTSGSDFSGDIFCAKYESGVLNTVVIPFVPQWYDAAASSSAFFSLCTGSSSYDCMVGECGGSKIWTTIWQSSGSGNIFPPSSVRYVMAQAQPMIC